MKQGIIPLLFFFFVAVVFSPFFLGAQLPIPSDTLVGLYHPFRDFYASTNPNGVVFDNFLITDPIRQQYPWRLLAIEDISQLIPPLWNPYTLSGTPLLASIQSAPLYPLNILFFLLPFYLSWSVLILLQPLLMGIFLYAYLRFFRFTRLASFFGGITYALCGFSIAWMEWNTIGHTALWLPLILLSLEKVFSLYIKGQNVKSKINNKKVFYWSALFLFSLTAAFFAGHWQTFFYLFLLTFVYAVLRFVQLGRPKTPIFVLFGSFVVFLLITSVQWLPSLQFIALSARDIDQSVWQQEGWFIPYKHLVQFVAPDFFGNPATLNYWGVWNYAEFVGYVGLIPLLFALFALMVVRSKKTIFFGLVLFASLVFALPTPLSQIPFILEIPLLSTSQPTRLLFLADFALAVLAALGMQEFSRRKKQFVFPLIPLLCILALLWMVVLVPSFREEIGLENSLVARRNLILPSLLFGITLIGYILSLIVKRQRFTFLMLLLFTAITVFDLSRFAQKFLSFSPQEYLYPQTQAIDFLQKQEGLFRIMATDSRIFPPNATIPYKLQTVDGYDPLYLRRYAELIAASERGEPNIKPPFGFNRIITPQNFESAIIDLLGVEYVLSLDDIESDKLELVFQEGETRIYQNLKAFPRVFSVEKITIVSTKEEAMKELFRQKDDLENVAIVEGYGAQKTVFADSDISIESYNSHKIVFTSSAEDDTFIVLTDSYYPTWKASLVDLNGQHLTPLPVYRTNYNFRGVIVPKGEHSVEFYNSIF